MKPAFTLEWREAATTYHIFLHSPADEGLAGPWPVMIFLDGDDQFAAAVEAYRTARAAGAVRPLLLVGVGYGAGFRKPANRRGRDYTPTAHSDEPGSGGGAAFLGFLESGLWPALASREPIDPTCRGLGGHSLGALVVLQALFQPRPFFSHHLASAPSLWWDDRSILALAGARHATGEPLPAELFLSVGEDDSASMTGDLALLESQLIGAPFDGLRVSTARFAGRDHFTVLPDAFGAGLRRLFPPAPNP